MAMTLAQIRANNNPVLTNLLLGASNDATSYVGAGLFPMLPQSLSTVQMLEMGSTHLRRYNLRRAPGGPTKRLEIKWSGKVVSLDQDSAEILMPREVIREMNESAKLNIGLWMEPSTIAMTTLRAVLDLAHEMDCAGLAADPTTYDSGMVHALSGAGKWSASTGTPVTDIRTAAELIRQAEGRRPNRITFSAADFAAVCMNPEVRSYLPNTQTGPANMEQLKTILNVKFVDVGDGIYESDDGERHDIWAGTTVLSYSPPISSTAAMNLGEPRFGITNVMEGHPYSETPYFDTGRKSWVYGATYERRPNVATKTAAFLFQNAS